MATASAREKRVHVSKRVQPALITLGVLSCGFFAQAASAFECAGNPVVGIPEAECEALVELFEATDGSQWEKKENWLDSEKPASEWFGVTVIGGNVRTLNLANNKLRGKLQKLSALTKLQFLFLEENQLSALAAGADVFPPSVGILKLNRNQIQGQIPAALGFLQNLEVLALGGNQFSGAIPEQLGSLPKLRVLSLGKNQLTGTIPSTLADIPFEAIYLDYNYLTGSIPSVLRQKVVEQHEGRLDVRQNCLDASEVGDDNPDDFLYVTPQRPAAECGSQKPGRALRDEGRTK